MAANLFGSMVRGFGFTLGRMAATSLVSRASRRSRSYDNYETYSPPSPYKTGIFQKFFIMGGWLWSIVYSLKTANSFPQDSESYSNWGAIGGLCFILGWLPIWLFFKLFNYITINSKIKKQEKEQQIIDEQEKTDLIPKIDSIFSELSKDYPFVNLELSSSTDGTVEWGTFKHTAETQQLKNIYAKFLSLVLQLRIYKAKGYDNDTICNVMNKELWLGMTEQHMEDMKGKPTKTEKETMKNGKIRTKHIYGNKTSGDVLVFEDDVLVSFKDR